MQETIACPHCGKPLVLKRAGRAPGPGPKFDHAQAIGLLRFGATNSEVAKVFGVSRQRVSQLRQEAGLPPARGTAA